MANVFAVKSGNWSDPTVWNTGALPTAADDVYSNTFTVTIDVSPTVLSCQNGATTGVTAGGQFVPANGITLTCTAAIGIQGSANGVYVFDSSLASGQSCSVAANIRVGGGTSLGLRNNGTGTVTVTGDVSGGSNSNNIGANNASSGTLNITGTVTGGNSTNCPGLLNSAAGTVNIAGNVLANFGFGVSNQGVGSVFVTGSVTGGVFTNIYGIANTSSGVVTITGNVTGGGGNSSGGTGSAHGVHNASTGSVTITGTVTGHATISSSAGANNASTGILTITGTVQAAAATGVTSANVSATNILTGPFLTNASGVNPVYAIRWFWQNTTPPATYYQIRTANLATIRPLYTADSVGGNPSVSNVRLGTAYGPSNELTGTCTIPPAGSVATGVPVDNTVGIADFSSSAQDFWDTTIIDLETNAPASSIGNRITKVPTLEAVGSYLAAFDRA